MATIMRFDINTDWVNLVDSPEFGELFASVLRNPSNLAYTGMDKYITFVGARHSDDPPPKG